MAVEYTWTDRPGPLGGQQERDWWTQNSLGDPPDHHSLLKSALRRHRMLPPLSVLGEMRRWREPAYDAMPEHMTKRGTADDGAPLLRDEIVTRAELAIALSRLPSRTHQWSVYLIYGCELSPQEAANVLLVSTRTVYRSLSDALDRMVALIFDYSD